MMLGHNKSWSHLCGTYCVSNCKGRYGWSYHCVCESNLSRRPGSDFIGTRLIWLNQQVTRVGYLNWLIDAGNREWCSGSSVAWEWISLVVVTNKGVNRRTDFSWRILEHLHRPSLCHTSIHGWSRCFWACLGQLLSDDSLVWCGNHRDDDDGFDCVLHNIINK